MIGPLFVDKIYMKRLKIETYTLKKFILSQLSNCRDGSMCFESWGLNWCLFIPLGHESELYEISDVLTFFHLI